MRVSIGITAECVDLQSLSIDSCVRIISVRLHFCLAFSFFPHPRSTWLADGLAGCCLFVQEQPFNLKCTNNKIGSTKCAIASQSKIMMSPRVRIIDGVTSCTAFLDIRLHSELCNNLYRCWTTALSTHSRLSIVHSLFVAVAGAGGKERKRSEN